MHETAARLYQAARELRGIEGQANVAKALNASSQTLHNWETRGVSNIGMLNAQEAFGCSPQWLRTGEGSMVLKLDAPRSNYVITDAGRQVPLISWVQAGDWQETIDNFAVGDAEAWITCPVPCSQHTFALRVRGASMEPEFTDGEMIFVDPKAEPRNKRFVIVRLDDTKEATFKQLIIEDARRYLRPLNPQWPAPIIEINGDATICGVVIYRGASV